MKCEKTAFLGHLYIKCIILPRQARDKHRENSETMPFSQEFFDVAQVEKRPQFLTLKVLKCF
jgi:hypothetical protein